MSSNNAIQVFNNEDFGEVRTIMIDGEPWFVANDVCKALEIDATRKTGQYGGALTSEQALILTIVQSDAPENRALALSEYREAISAPFQAVIEEQKPKVTYYDVVMRSDDLIPTTVIAKDYGFSASKLNSLLNEFGVQFKLGGQWFLYSKYAGCGYMHSVTSIVRTGHVCMSSQWTQKGRKFVYDVMKKNGYLPLIEKAETAIY